MTGNNRKYRTLARDAKFMSALARVYRDMLASPSTSVLAKISYLHYEKLKHRPLSSVRIMNGRIERLLFRETDEGLNITIIELNNDHYGNKK